MFEFIKKHKTKKDNADPGRVTVDYDSLMKIRRSVSLAARTKTSNILEGEFTSMYKGRGMDFDDLKEYQYGDDIHDIDWAASSRSDKMIVRRYIPEKKHTVLFVCDNGAKMRADGAMLETKLEVARDVFATMGFLVDSRGADYAIAYSNEQGWTHSTFASGQMHLESLLHGWLDMQTDRPEFRMEELLQKIIGRDIRRMIVVIITDLDGLSQLDDKTLRMLTLRHDVMVVNIDDAYLSGSTVYNMDDEHYEPDYILHSRSLQEAERRERGRLWDNARKLCRQYRVTMVTVGGKSEILDRVMELFEKHRREAYG